MTFRITRSGTLHFRSPEGSMMMISNNLEILPYFSTNADIFRCGCNDMPVRLNTHHGFNSSRCIICLSFFSVLVCWCWTCWSMKKDRHVNCRCIEKRQCPWNVFIFLFTFEKIGTLLLSLNKSVKENGTLSRSQINVLKRHGVQPRKTHVRSQEIDVHRILPVNKFQNIVRFVFGSSTNITIVWSQRLFFSLSDQADKRGILQHARFDWFLWIYARRRSRKKSIGRGSTQTQLFETILIDHQPFTLSQFTSLLSSFSYFAKYFSLTL